MILVTSAQITSPVSEEAVAHRLRQLASAARNREPDGLTQHDQQQPEEARPGPVQRNVCVQGVSGEQQPYGMAAELLFKAVDAGAAFRVRRTGRPPRVT